MSAPLSIMAIAVLLLGAPRWRFPMAFVLAVAAMIAMAVEQQ